MPNRIIKESICTSEKMASLTDFEFRLWTGLLTSVDDTGRGDARAAIIKGRVFPLCEQVTVKEISEAMKALAEKNCIMLYQVEGKQYFLFPNWSKHQRVREVKSKFPAPEEKEQQPAATCEDQQEPAASCENSRQSAASCGELPQTAANCGLNPNPNTNTNPNPNPNPNPNSNPNTKSNPNPNFREGQENPKAPEAQPQAKQDEEEDDSPVFITLPLNDGEEFPITEKMVWSFRELYPSIDVKQNLKTMRGWCLGNPGSRKPKNDILRFIHYWLSKEQGKAPKTSRRGFIPLDSSDPSIKYRPKLPGITRL